MPTANKVADFTINLMTGILDLDNDTLMIALSNTAPAAEASDPTAAGNGVLANVTQIAYANYTDDMTVDRTLENQTVTASGASRATLDVDDVTITASGGDVGPFQYVYFYSDTPSAPADPLLGMIDLDSPVTVTDGNNYALRPDAAGGIVHIE